MNNGNLSCRERDKEQSKVILYRSRLNNDIFNITLTKLQPFKMTIYKTTFPLDYTFVPENMKQNYEHFFCKRVIVSAARRVLFFVVQKFMQK